MTVLLWLLLGWVAGAGAGLLARQLTGVSASPPVAGRLGRARVLLVDPTLQAAAAIALAALAWRQPLGPSLLIHSLYALALLALLVVDWRTRYVYDAMAYPALALTVILTPLASVGPPWQGLAGAVAGGALFGALYLAGRLLYRDGPAMGAGDVTLAAILGAMVGLDRVLAGLLLASLIGAVLAAWFGWRARSLKAALPYGPSLCLGALALLIFSVP